MKTKLLALVILAGSSGLFAGTRVFVGVGLGFGAPAPVAVYAPPPPVAYYAPPVARPGYTWVSGYYYPVGPRWAWRAGYWARPPYAHAYWVGPRYHGGHFYGGYWRR